MNQELREKFSKEIDALNLEQVTERLSAMDEEVRAAKDVQLVEELRDKKSMLLERKAELEDLEARKKDALELRGGASGNRRERGGNEMPEERTFAVDTKEYREAFLKHLMGKELSAEERTAVSAKAVIPTSTLNKIVSQLENAPLLRRITILQIAGHVSIPYETEVDDASWIEMSAASTDSKANVDKLELAAYKLIKTVEIDAEVSAMAIDAFETWLVNRLTQKMQAALQTAIITGTGNSQPKGLTADKQIATTKTFTKGGVTYKDVLGIMAGLKASYHPFASWSIPSALFFNEILGMVDANKRPIVIQDVQEGGGYRLMGKPVDLVDAKEDTIIFGAFDRYHMNLGDGIEIKADESVAFRTGSTVYRAKALVDGGNADPNAFVLATRATE